MKGQILDFSVQTNSGAISGDDGNRYTFTGDSWQESGVPQRGMRVDFEADGSVATGIYSDSSVQPQPAAGVATGPQYPKNKIAAGLLAIFLGWLGIHKFYLGYPGAGALFIALYLVVLISACTIIGLVIAIPLALVLWIITLVEGVIYLTKSDEDFHQTYVVNSRMFF